MKVKELIEFLKKCPEDHLIIMSKDGEGNKFSPLEELYIDMYIPDSTWSGELYNSESSEIYKENAVVLWPVN